MVKEVKNLTNIKLTESDTDGIWLHFETAKGLAAGVALSSLLRDGGIINKTLEAWAREQLDRQPHMVQGEHTVLDPLPTPPSNEFLKEGNEERTAQSDTRPSPPVDGGY